MREWRKNHRQQIRETQNLWYKEQRKKALLIVGRGILKCSRCGTREYGLLEINHKNGGGRQEHKLLGHGSNLIRQIITGKRKIDDLNLLCRPCNLVDAAERMSGRKYAIVS